MDTIFTPGRLYTAKRLLAGFDASDPIGITKSFDFDLYRRFVIAGGSVPLRLQDGVGFATHDAYISRHLRGWVERRQPRLVGIMGGHSLARNDPAYGVIARLARSLSVDGYTIVTGGGPGAMEAANLGAATASGDAATLDAALTAMARARVPQLNDLSRIVDKHGVIDRDLAAEAHAWFDTAFRVRATLPTDLHESLAVPTWLYGGEPLNPFATVYAKYFSDSLREETLISRSRAGILYAPGGGGTLREIFEDLEENFYAHTVEDFTPMVFLNVGDYWHAGRAPATVEVRSVIEQAIRLSPAGRRDPAPLLAKVLFTIDEAEIAQVLARQVDAAISTMQAFLAGDGAAVTSRAPF